MIEPMENYREGVEKQIKSFFKPLKVCARMHLAFFYPVHSIVMMMMRMMTETQQRA